MSRRWSPPDQVDTPITWLVNSSAPFDSGVSPLGRTCLLVDHRVRLEPLLELFAGKAEALVVDAVGLEELGADNVRVEAVVHHQDVHSRAGPRLRGLDLVKLFLENVRVEEVRERVQLQEAPRLLQRARFARKGEGLFWG